MKYATQTQQKKVYNVQPELIEIIENIRPKVEGGCTEQLTNITVEKIICAKEEIK